MKKLSTLIAIAIMLFASITSYATIWRVNNTGIPADFTTLQTAHDDVNVLAGDTLHIEPSINSYGALTATKPLVILGPGYFLTQNLNNQYNPVSAKVDQVNFNSGSQGSIIAGLELTSNIYIKISQIAVLRNNGNAHYLYLNNGGSGPISNILINGNYSLNIRDDNNSYSITNLLISNNYLTGLSLTQYVSASVENNIVQDNSGNAINMNNSVVKNNIFYSYAGGLTYLNSVLYNNLDNSTYVPSTNNNQQNVNMATVFVGLTGNSTDGQWALATGSPAIGAGLGGVDCGIYDGSNPYKLSGLPAIPSVYYLNVPSSSNGNTLPVTISVKSNN